MFLGIKFLVVIRSGNCPQQVSILGTFLVQATAQFFFEHERLKKSSWAERPDISKQEFIERKAKGLLQSCLGEVQLDAVSGLPLNPVGRTGISGRGLLGKFGANYAVDPLVIQKKENKYHLLVIQKEDGSWALPGGMVDAGEDVTSAVYRELHE